MLHAIPAPLSAALDRRREQQCVLHCPRRQRAGARLFLFRGRARSALGGQAAHPRRGPPHGGELRQAAGAAAPVAAEKRGVTRLPPSHFARQSAQFPLSCNALSDAMVINGNPDGRRKLLILKRPPQPFSQSHEKIVDVIYYPNGLHLIISFSCVSNTNPPTVLEISKLGGGL